MEFFNSIDWVNVLVTVGYIVLGGVVAYYKGNATLQSKTAEVIKTAECNLKGVQRGGERFEWAVDYLYGVVPAPLRTFISRSVIENMVQATFDNMAEFAKEQLDKAVDAIEGE